MTQSALPIKTVLFRVGVAFGLMGGLFLTVGIVVFLMVWLSGGIESHRQQQAYNDERTAEFAFMQQVVDEIDELVMDWENIPEIESAIIKGDVLAWWYHNDFNFKKSMTSEQLGAWRKDELKRDPFGDDKWIKTSKMFDASTKSKKITVFLIREGAEAVGEYETTKRKAFAIWPEVVVISWPEKLVIGKWIGVTLRPPKEIEFEPGEKYFEGIQGAGISGASVMPQTKMWINTLPRE